jgi:hypothetical protein
MKKRILVGLACTSTLLLLLGLVAGAGASPNSTTLLSRAGLPFESTWAGAPGPGGAVAISSGPASWNDSLEADGAAWIWSEYPVTAGRGVSGDLVEFTHTFDLECTPISAELDLDITADNEYRVYLNETMVADSIWTEINPNTCPRYVDDRTYQTVSQHHDLTGPFLSGSNSLVFKVLNLPCYTDSGNPGGLIYKAVITYECPLEVQIDIKPGSYPNCFNLNSHGVIPVAINGTADFDVTQIDVSTLKFAGLDVRVKGNGASQCSVEDWNMDGYDDLVCQFVDDATTWAPDSGTATLSGNLLDGTPFTGTDEICLRPE